MRILFGEAKRIYKRDLLKPNLKQSDAENEMYNSLAIPYGRYDGIGIIWWRFEADQNSAVTVSLTYNSGQNDE